MRAVVGLGNPGPEYAANRHNIGFRVVSAFRDRFRLPRFSREGPVELSRGRFRGRPVVLVRPQTYMNRSGEAVRHLMRSERLTLEELLVIVDDVYLPVGRLRVRGGGGDGGHNGLRSIIDACGSEMFPRLRFGVGGPDTGGDLADFVLEDFTSEEEVLVEKVLPAAVQAVATYLQGGVDAAMNRFNAPSEPGVSPGAAPGGERG